MSCGERGEFGEGLDLHPGWLDDVPALVQERPDLALGLGRASAAGSSAIFTYIPKAFRYEDMEYAMSGRAQVPMMRGLLVGEA